MTSNYERRYDNRFIKLHENSANKIVKYYKEVKRDSFEKITNDQILYKIH
jgi:hypothetical protein